MGFGLDDCTYWHLIHTTRDYRQYSAIAVPHTLQFTVAHALGFSVFSSRILATDLSQSHCNFKSHIKFSFRNLIPFLPFLLIHLILPSPELNPFLESNSLKWTLLQLNSLNFSHQLTQIISSATELPQLPTTTNSNDRLCPLISPRHGPRRRQPLYCWDALFTHPLPSNGSISHNT
jgi:hypothetical protein